VAGTPKYDVPGRAQQVEQTDRRRGDLDEHHAARGRCRALGGDRGLAGGPDLGGEHGSARL
jgi:hypothetical protein